ncbi:MAG TPA: hypothetical protein VL400_05250 [Polyangiaceae bacterium]|nr:hypothetical protein [Polyangiaceae bacterium]
MGPASPPITLPSVPVDHDFRADPLVFSAAFDGSLRYSLWLRTMRFARKMKAEHGSMPHLTFFVNAAFYSTEDAPSDVGRAHTHAEVLVRRALTQLAINEGHDIGDHGFGHFDGSRWSREEWDRELDHFHAVMSSAVFEPVRDDEGKALFPVFEPLAGASPREVGAACSADADCDSGMCIEITPETKLCSAACNLSAKCPKGTACGAPMFRDDTDVCLPPPRFPLVVDGVTMFDARGEPNPKHPRLRPYPIVGFRAPYLASNDAMYESLLGHGYLFDTSQAVTPAPPYWFSSASPSSAGSRRLLELALMPWPGARAVPMDYNYRLDKAPGSRMEADYRAGLVAAYDAGHWPWNIGHHFATWEDGEYLDVLERTVDFALSGCPDDAGKARCPDAVVLSSRELAKKLAASAPAPRR